MSEKTRVLVVDDQRMALGYFELYVKSSMNYELVQSLPTAEAAVTFCDRHAVDLIVMDIMMRYGIDGLTAAEQIKKRHPKIKIILATSTSESNWE
ncbi:MAG: response regulator, partial [Clostridia bacterium]|nr:response regulator [Clostridia bacterium]